jgi:hypothetical protein
MTYQPMIYDELAKSSKIPEKILRRIFADALVSEPLSAEEFLCLRFLEKVWGNTSLCRAWIRHFLAKQNKAARAAFLNTLDYETKWERYAFSRFHNHHVREKKLRMISVVAEIENHFGVDLTPFQKRRLYAIRNKVYNLRKKNKTRNLVKQRN